MERVGGPGSCSVAGLILGMAAPVQACGLTRPGCRQGRWACMAWSWRRSRRSAGWPGPRLEAAVGGRRRRPVGDLSSAVSGRIPSPGGWVVPPGVRPAWNWTPPPGIVPRPDRAPRWVRWWYGTPVIDRYAYSWMWWHGAWDVVPAVAPAPGGGDIAGVREPRRPRAPSGAGAAPVPQGPDAPASTASAPADL